MDPETLAEFRALRAKRARALQRRELEEQLRQPMAHLVAYGYSCFVDDDGSEVFSDGKGCTIRVPPECVQWTRRPEVDAGAVDLTPEESARYEALNKQLRAIIES